MLNNNTQINRIATKKIARALGVYSGPSDPPNVNNVSECLTPLCRMCGFIQ